MGQDPEDLKISTPERVSFGYGIAGVGSRFLAQAIDTAVLTVGFIVLAIGAGFVAAAAGSLQVFEILFIALSFLTVYGYFLASEAIWSGQTLGKRALSLRVVGDMGEPISFAQAAIRNLLRVVDFLPAFYGIGLITLFANGRGKRLGDLAAGTVVVREQRRISLYDLSAATPAVGPPRPFHTPTKPDTGLHLDPALSRLVTAYAARRNELEPDRREAIARDAEIALRRVLPLIVSEQGPLAALDQLAGAQGLSPARQQQGDVGTAFGLGVASLITSLLLFFFPPVAIVLGILSIVVARRAIRSVRAQPDRYFGDERAATGRLLGIIGLSIGSLLLLVWLASLASSLSR